MALGSYKGQLCDHPTFDRLAQKRRYASRSTAANWTVPVGRMHGERTWKLTRSCPTDAAPRWRRRGSRALVRRTPGAHRWRPVLAARPCGDSSVRFGSFGPIRQRAQRGNMHRVSPVLHPSAKARWRTLRQVHATRGVVAGALLMSTFFGVLAAGTPADAATFGYWLVSAKGNVYNLGAVPFKGSEAGKALPAPIVGMAATPDRKGYWLVSSKGNVYNFGDAPFKGSEAGKALPAPIVGIAAFSGGGGYWLVSAKGNVYNFGIAPFKGSEAGKPLPAPVVGMTTTSDGYLLVTAKGNVYHFGDATFLGSEAGKSLPAAIVSIALVVCGPPGYWLVTAKGNLYPFGSAGFSGSEAGKALPAPIVGMAANACGPGYWFVGGKGSVYTFGGAHFFGSEAGKKLPSPIVGMAV